jgi:hypothetical protein
MYLYTKYFTKILAGFKSKHICLDLDCTPLTNQKTIAIFDIVQIFLHGGFISNLNVASLQFKPPPKFALL